MKASPEKHEASGHASELLDCIPFGCVHDECPACKKYYCYAHLYEKNDTLEVSFHCDHDKSMCEHMWNLGRVLVDYAVKDRKDLLTSEERINWFCSFCAKPFSRSTYKCPSCGYMSPWRQGKST